jgi:hypothetical protein
MEDRIGLAVCVLGGAAVLGLLGAVFGGLANVLLKFENRWAGGLLGATVVDAMERLAGRPLTWNWRRGLTGGTDGFAFLAVLGAVLGGCTWGYAIHAGTEPVPLLAWVLLLVGILVLTAALFGLLAYFLQWAGVRALGGLFIGAMAGAVVGGRWVGSDGLFFGTLGGALVGAVVAALLGRPRRPPAPRTDEEPPDEPGA